MTNKRDVGISVGSVDGQVIVQFVEYNPRMRRYENKNVKISKQDAIDMADKLRYCARE